MSTIHPHNDALLQALSSFWLRLFADRDILEGLYKGTNQQLGQVYLDVLETALSRSLSQVPVYHREYWQLVTVREDGATYNPADGSYTFDLPDNVVDCSFLYNKVFSPSVILEKNIDFSIIPPDDTTGAGAKIKFVASPFGVNGVPTRRVDILPVPTLTGADGQVVNGHFYSASSAANFNTFDVGDQLLLTSYTQGGTYTVTALSTDTLSGSPVTTLTLDRVLTVSESNLSWTLQTVGPVQEAAFWVPNASVDKRVLSDSYGWLVGHERFSSDAYRALLRGIFQFYILGAGLSRIEAALNVAINVPVVQNDGEIITAIALDRVITDHATYLLPSGSVKASLLVGDTVNAFASLTDIFAVSDYISNPAWWWNITLPVSSMPNEPAARRQITPQLYENRYNNPPDLVKYGDPGVIYGADDTGNPVNPSLRPSYRHGYSYVMMDRLLKYNMFGVLANPDYLPTDFGADVVQAVLLQGRPAYTLVYAAPQLKRADQASFADIFTLGPTFNESMQASRTTGVAYGDGAKYNDYYYYDGSGNVIIGNGTADRSLGQVPVCYGQSSDPYTVTTEATTKPIDWPVSIVTRT